MTARKKNPHGIEPDDELRRIDGLDEPTSVDGLLQQIGTALGVDTDNGWGAIKDAGAGLQKQRVESQRVFKREANIFRDTFSTPAGRKCLQIMREMTIDAQPYPAEAMLPIDAITALVIAHNAQTNFVWSIFQAIAQADGKEAKTRKAT